MNPRDDRRRHGRDRRQTRAVGDVGCRDGRPRRRRRPSWWRRWTTPARELAGGWVAITDGLVSGVGAGPAPAAATVLDATDCLVTPGLVNAHHHLFQNLTRAYPADDRQAVVRLAAVAVPAVASASTPRRAYVSAWVGLAELALSGCTTSTDHLYLHPHGAGDLLAAEIDGGDRPRDALPPDAGLDVAVGEGRRAATRRRGGRRRRDPRRQRGCRAGVITIAATVRWCGWRWRRARRSASPSR